MLEWIKENNDTEMLDEHGELKVSEENYDRAVFSTKKLGYRYY